jgi:glycine cleavage system H protein
MEFPEEFKYTEEHEWVMVEKELATIGISDFAQDALGDVVFVELPEVGAVLVKAVSDIYAPISGTVEEINDDLVEAPEIINTSPYEDGWMIKIRMADASDADKLMDADAYQALIAEES